MGRENLAGVGPTDSTSLSFCVRFISLILQSLAPEQEQQAQG